MEACRYISPIVCSIVKPVQKAVQLVSTYIMHAKYIVMANMNGEIEYFLKLLKNTVVTT